MQKSCWEHMPDYGKLHGSEGVHWEQCGSRDFAVARTWMLNAMRATTTTIVVHELNLVLIAMVVRQRGCEPRELNDRHFRISLRRTLHRRDVFWQACLNVGLVARMVIFHVCEVKLNAKSEVANITTLLKLQSWWTCALGIEAVQQLPPRFLQLLLWLYTRLYNAVRRSTIFSAFKW